MSDGTRYDTGEIRITLADLADAADKIVGVIDGVESVEAAQELLWAWFSGASTSSWPTRRRTPPTRNTASPRAFTDALERKQEEQADNHEEGDEQ